MGNRKILSPTENKSKPNQNQTMNQTKLDIVKQTGADITRTTDHIPHKGLDQNESLGSGERSVREK